jgi:TatD DNase family protein
MLIDTHCHLADEAFAGDLDALALRARTAGVMSALCILSADAPAELARVPLVAAAWPSVRFAAGIHPHHAGLYADRVDEVGPAVRAASAAGEAVAIGEIGLDYHYDHAPRGLQQEVFAAQLDLALASDRPVIIHTREATDDTVSIIRAAGAAVRGVMHCFTGTVDEARQALDLGFFVSMSGILTFPRSTQLRDVAAFVPVDRLFVETDAPYLAPVPHRGKRNEPAWVVETYAVLAGIRAMTVEELSRHLFDNIAALLPEMKEAHAR